MCNATLIAISGYGFIPSVLKIFFTGETGKWKDFRDDVRIRYSDGIMLTLITAQNNERIMEVKTKEDWLYQFRRCSSRETLEKVISHTRYKLTPAEMEAFNSAVDHRLAETDHEQTVRSCSRFSLEICYLINVSDEVQSSQ